MDIEVRESTYRTCMHPKPCTYLKVHTLIPSSHQGFYDPVNEVMFEPNLTGISYSFTADGYYEEALYRAISNRASLIHLPSSRPQLTFPSNNTLLPLRNPPMATRNLRHRHQRDPQHAKSLPDTHQRRRPLPPLRALHLQDDRAAAL